MSFSFECFAVTHIGNFRKKQEDNFLLDNYFLPEETIKLFQTECKQVVKRCIINTTDNTIIAVSDGMGGHKYGEVASLMVVQGLMEYAKKHIADPGIKKRDKTKYIRGLQEAIGKINQDILRCASERNADKNMGATLSGLIIFPRVVVPINIGDSSTFLYEKGKLSKLTIDDNEKSLFSSIDSSKLKNNGKRLVKYFGLPESCGILTATISPSVSIKENQIYIIASDGLTDYLSVDNMSTLIKDNINDIQKVAELYLKSILLNENGGRDNITVIIVKILPKTKRRFFSVRKQYD